MAKVKSPAKINLFLHILDKRSDGYHQLESLFYFPEIYDEIEIIEGRAGGGRLQVTGRFADRLNDSVDDNIILKTYHLLKEKFPNKIPDLSFILTKNLPVAAGIGGGSGNAAAVINALNDEYELMSLTEMLELGKTIGADVPPMIFAKTCYAEGIGEILTEVETMPKLNILLANPLKAVSTAEIFKMGFAEKSNNMEFKTAFKNTQSVVDLLETTKNDLEKNAKKLCPEINDALDAISKHNGCLLTRMSGSGATCFGIFDTKDNALMAKEALAKTGWWLAVD